MRQVKNQILTYRDGRPVEAVTSPVERAAAEQLMRDNPHWRKNREVVFIGSRIEFRWGNVVLA